MECLRYWKWYGNIKPWLGLGFNNVYKHIVLLLILCQDTLKLLKGSAYINHLNIDVDNPMQGREFSSLVN